MAFNDIKINSPVGIRTPIVRVTGGYTNPYTTEDEIVRMLTFDIISYFNFANSDSPHFSDQFGI